MLREESFAARCSRARVDAEDLCAGPELENALDRIIEQARPAFAAGDTELVASLEGRLVEIEGALDRLRRQLVDRPLWDPMNETHYPDL